MIPGLGQFRGEREPYIAQTDHAGTSAARFNFLQQ
jgi:hypothetical protein